MFTEITCDEPAAGQNVVITNGDHAPYIVRQTISYRCSQGYKTEDFLTITCQENGHWNRRAPNCQGEARQCWKFSGIERFHFSMLCTFLCPESKRLSCRGVVLTPHSLLCMRPVISLLLNITATHCREMDQGEGHSDVKAIISYIIPCSLRT